MYSRYNQQTPNRWQVALLTFFATCFLTGQNPLVVLSGLVTTVTTTSAEVKAE
jgi:hypothetical protein